MTKTTPKIVSYKGFDKDLKCRGFQYKVGETFKHDGDVKTCKSGFHACEYPLDVFGYYPPAGNRFAVVEQSGELSRNGDDSKVASKSILIKAEIDFAGIVKAAIEYTTSRCAPVDPESPASATGEASVALATGDQGAASATGIRGAASATGIRGAASATGYRGAASATGDQGAASATGIRGAALATGDASVALATGYWGEASATGYQGAASATGYQGAASATGYRGAASATGYQGAASATGDQGAASATGEASVALATGRHGCAQAAEGCAIVLVFRDENGNIVHIRSSKVGENGIKAGTLYTLDEKGDFQECNQ
jgi:hypothetical protein